MTRNFGYYLYWVIIKLSRSNIFFRFTIDWATVIFYKAFRSDATFTFNGRKYNYFYHVYNRTIAGERIIEVPIAHRIIEQYKGKEILEVGNVMSHYYKSSYDILDKYEKGKGVINKDVVSYKFKKKYDLIISVSTMEHVGWTYGERKEPGKLLKGLNNLKKYVKPGGKMVVTFPLYYRKDLSEHIIKRKLPFQEEYFMKRVSFLNEWKQIKKEEAVKGNAYEGFFANANILFIGVYSK